MMGRALRLASRASDTFDAIDATRALPRQAIVGSGRATWGAQGLRREGVGGIRNAIAVLRGDAFHTDAHRELALADLDRGFAGTLAELEQKTAGDAQDSPRSQWMSEEVRPLVAEWSAFVAAERASWVTRFATQWDVFQAWHRRLSDLRSDARQYGIALTAPPPKPLPSTFWERGASGRGGPWETIWTAVKVIVYAAATLVGVVGLWTVYREVRFRLLAVNRGAGWRGALALE